MHQKGHNYTQHNVSDGGSFSKHFFLDMNDAGIIRFLLQFVSFLRYYTLLLNRHYQKVQL
jgi:hypothetical protein